MTSREIALKALYDIDVNDTFLNVALKNALADVSLSAADRGLITEIIYGVTANRTAIDFIISKYSKIKLKKMTPWVLGILRMGVFQMFYMDRIPHSAACNEAVKLAKKYSHRAGSGFVNGVLRAFSREAESFDFPKGKTTAEYLSLKYSYPLWMVKKLEDEYGFERSRQLFEESQKAHGVFVRVNSLKTTKEKLVDILTKEGVECEETDVEGCIRVRGRINVDRLKSYSDGLFSLQNISSQKAVLALEPKPDEFVVDMCAAPGGKSCAIAEKMNNRGKVVSFDVFEHKIELIKKSAERLGIGIIEAYLQDAREKRAELVGKADRVLADVPCSGLGVLHKKPDIKWKRTEADIAELCQIQSEVLDTASSYVKSGGCLVYSTCTILPEENRLMTESFLKRHTDFRKVSEEQLLTTEKGESGFYICKMVKG
ncbi:MAG: 16S rRNA (cytosine(967)-C(5))-methyltransferase RsmB [Clostridia bacterium]|nr:16S rRNA (cytosine(967)-C(5))-methyltransferase RsmB [Clostridia bacterium]